MSVLPISSPALSRQVSDSVANYLDVPDFSALWSPDTCPEKLLIILAWSLAVDIWDEDWPEQVKRNVVGTALDVHRMRGTTHALQEAVRAQGYTAKIKYWFDDSDIQKGMFRVAVNTSEQHVGDQFYKTMLKTIANNKRGTLHLDKFEIKSSVTAKVNVGCHVSRGIHFHYSARES